MPRSQMTATGGSPEMATTQPYKRQVNSRLEATVSLAVEDDPSPVKSHTGNITN